MVRCVTLPYLYAGKMHALVFRNWQARVKGRDWYDFEWYVANKVPLNFAHLQRRIREFYGIEMTKDDFMKAVEERLSTTDISLVKQDVQRFLNADSHTLNIWSNNYFLQLAEMIVFDDKTV